jgi:glycosyltransferase involved in cell wall biosynthesis
MRNIVIYRNELLPASETFVLTQANALRRFTPVFAGIKQVRSGLHLSPYSLVTISDSEQLHEKLRCRIFLRTGRAQKFQDAITVHAPELIHAHFATDASVILPLAMRLRLPLVVTLHGYDIFCNDQVFCRWPATRAYLRRKGQLWQYASLFLCVSENVRQQAVTQGFPQEKLLVHRIGVALEEMPPSPDLRERATILFVGRLVEKKGCIYLVRAMSRVLEKIPDAKLIIIGSGPLRNMLEYDAQSWRHQITFLGQQSHEQVKQWMRRARVLAVPSIRASDGDQEGLPTVLCEAQALGLPVITFATNAVTEALPPERRSEMPREGDAPGLADAIVRLIEDDFLWQGISIRGRQYIEGHFDVTRQTRILEEKYEEVIARPRG